MESRMARILKLRHLPVALSTKGAIPKNAAMFKAGKRGCVMHLFAAAAKGRAAAITEASFGCIGAKTACGFPNPFANYPGGKEAFFGFLSSGNGHTAQGRQTGEALAARNKEFAFHYLHGEGYKKTPGLAREWHEGLPRLAESPKQIIFMSLRDFDPEEAAPPEAVIFVANPLQLSALATAANYHRPGRENVILPWASGCQQICLLPLAENQGEQPRAVLGLTDLSARQAVLKSLGADVLTLAVPWSLFLEMEKNIPGSFLERTTFQEMASLL